MCTDSSDFGLPDSFWESVVDRRYTTSVDQIQRVLTSAPWSAPIPKVTAETIRDAYDRLFPPRTIVVNPGHMAEAQREVEEMGIKNLDVVESTYIPKDTAFIVKGHRGVGTKP